MKLASFIGRMPLTTVAKRRLLRDVKRTYRHEGKHAALAILRLAR